MRIQLLALTVFICSSAFGMQKNKVTLSRNQLLAVMRTTLITERVADKLYAGLQGVIPADATPAKIAEQAGQNVIAKVENGATLTDSAAQEIMVTSIASYFSSTALKKIRHLVKEEVMKFTDGIVPR